ncbi:MAG: KH domain-containing protein [bacterium]
MNKALEYIVKNIVKNPKDVTVKQEDIDNITRLQVTANKEDMGTIIGKQGRVIKAIKELIKVKAIKENKYFDIQVSEK